MVKSVEGIAPISSLDILNTPTTRKLSLLHTKAYFFSDELAREGLGRWMTSLNRLREFRETANIYIVRGQAREFIEQNQSQLESNPAKQYELMNIISDVNSIFLPMQFLRFYEESKLTSIQPTYLWSGCTRVVWKPPNPACAGGIVQYSTLQSG